jgi:hypothetical protein
METEFESRISFNKIKLRARKQAVYQAAIYWNVELYETIKATKDLCIEELKRKAGI